MSSDNEKKKRAFRNTKDWKTFRHLVISKQKLDFLTQKKLSAGCQVHHCDTRSENYKNLTEDNFVALNRQSHTFIHWIYGYWCKDKSIIERLVKLLEKMEEASNG